MSGKDKQYTKSEKWIRQQLDEVRVCKQSIQPQSVVIIADTTFVKRTFGVCVFRSQHLQKNLVWEICSTETADRYRELRSRLEGQGFKIQAAVIDGKPGLLEVFENIPMQMCHFHQMAIMTRYLTTRPKLPAGKELRQAASMIPNCNEYVLEELISRWHRKWKFFLNEKTYNPETERCFYTHRRLRSAYRSINKNVSLLYTYQKYPQLNIPNTTNSLDGTFSHLKDMLRIHRGLGGVKKFKLIDEILSK